MGIAEQVKETKLAEKLRKADEEAERAAFETACETSRTALQEHVGRLVEYQESGTRIGYLVRLNPWTGTIQPLGSIGASKPEEVLIDLPSIHACSAPTKYATLEEYAAAKGWNMKATLIMPGKKAATTTTKKVAFIGKATPAVAVAIQAAAADTQMVDVLKLDKPFVVGPHDDITVEEVSSPAPESKGGAWNPARAVELFKGGMKIIDIAVEMGYPRGSGQNRTKGALKKAGLL